MNTDFSVATRVISGFGLALTVLVLLASRPAYAATFEVDSTADTDLRACTNAPNDCTLRGAINASNASPSIDDTISFEIPGTDPNCDATSDVCTIRPTSLLPGITDKVTIDGYTQSGASENTARTNANNAVLKIELSGTDAPSNAFGLAVSGTGATGTTIRGLVINRFADVGVFVNTPDTVLEGNFIGTNAAGDIVLGNGTDGVQLLSPGNRIGGPANGAQNVISGNGENGVAIKTTSATENTVSNNHIGTDADAEEDLGNTESGVFIEDAPDNTVGGNGADGAGEAEGEGNIISGNDQHGVRIIGEGSSGTRVLGNYIGLNRNDNGLLGNSLDGVLVSSTPQVEIGGTEEGQGNTISDNGQHGVEISGFSATGSKVQGNRIGTNFNGSSVGNGNDSFGNEGAGVRIVSPPDTKIGGTDADDGVEDGTVDARNVISGNRQNGVFISGGFNATNNKVEGNFIGTDRNGMSDLGNGGSGVRIEAPGSSVGGTAPGARNVISGSSGSGVLINGTNATGNLVQGNFIGTNVNGTGDDLGNLHGVFLTSAPDNTIGGTGDTAANTISRNTRQGVFVGSCTCTTGNRILRNSIFDNGLLGIELGLTEDGPTPNDNKDPDTGPNLLQNFPKITSASTTKIKGKLNSRPGKTFTIQFFASSVADTSGFGEGENFLGEISVRTNNKGKARFTFAGTVPVDHFVTATATDAKGNTSEFSETVAVASG